MELSTITARDIMTCQLISTLPQTHVVDAIERLIAHQVSGLPVLTSSGQPVGRFSERSAISALDLGRVKSDSKICWRMRQVKAVDIMSNRMPVLSADEDVFQCIHQLVKHSVSGAPVVDSSGKLCGVFSEQSAMHVYIGMCWEQLPSAKATAWLDRHDDRRIGRDTRLNEILERFQETQYRRLMIVDKDEFVGQVTRQGALQSAFLQSRDPVVLSQGSHTGQQMDGDATVSSWMELEEERITADADVLAIARNFLESSARQLLVVDGDRLVGQISRSDLLRAVQRSFPDETASEYKPSPLYISSLTKHHRYSLS